MHKDNKCSTFCATSARQPIMGQHWHTMFDILCHVRLPADEIVEIQFAAELQLDAGESVAGAEFRIMGLDRLEAAVAQILDRAEPVRPPPDLHEGPDRQVRRIDGAPVEHLRLFKRTGLQILAETIPIAATDIAAENIKRVNRHGIVTGLVLPKPLKRGFGEILLQPLLHIVGQRGKMPRRPHRTTES